MRKNYIEINGRKIGPGKSVYIIAEMSGNHNQDLNKAIQIIKSAKCAGADAVKLQTYTPDTITIDCNNEYFKIRGTLWEGKYLYDLYRETYTPWEWHLELKKIASDIGIDLFSTPFDPTAVDFLSDMDIPAYKISSFEITDLPLLKKISQTKKPIIMSTGMASISEISDAIQAVFDAGGRELALLKCTSAYPAPFEEMNLRTIPNLSENFGLPVGLSDHTMGLEAPVAAVALGACIIEKHFTLSRDDHGTDSSFSMEPQEFEAMVAAIRNVEKALGNISYGVTEKQKESIVHRRSLFIVKDMKAGEVFTRDNIRSIRPAYGLLPRHINEAMGKKITKDAERGTPLTWDIILP